MSRLTGLHAPLLGLGMTSVVLGLIGLLLGWMPILGLPISAFGLFFGLVGSIAAFFPSGATLRWSLAGIGICSLALAVTIALAYAPAGYLHDPGVPPSWQAPPDRPSNPPPSKWFD
jgi:hypothetical protein